MGDIVFAEGVLANMWAGIFTQVQKSAPGPFSPFSFDEATAISDSSENDRSLILEINTLTKGGLIKSIGDVKALAKTARTVPQDFHSFNFQLKVFTIAVVFVFGKDSILATKLRDFVIIYKNKIVIIDTFAAKILWSVDCFTQLFLEDYSKFDGLNINIILYCFHTILSPPFHKLNDKSDKNDNPKSGARKGKHKGNSNGNEEEQRNSQNNCLEKSPMPIRSRSSRWQKGRLGRGPSKENAPQKE